MYPECMRLWVLSLVGERRERKQKKENTAQLKRFSGYNLVMHSL
jgi:hypothetical protein